VVDDDEHLRGTVVDLLNRDGYDADGIADREQALAMSSGS
jgi:DNA-binding response OmpR family regulator